MSIRDEQIFLERLAQLAKGFDITPELLRHSTALLRNIHNEQESANFLQEGPCLHCSTDTRYGPVLPKAHRTYGETWYEKLRSRWASKKATDVQVSYAGVDQNLKPAFTTLLNGYAMRTVWAYFCPKCRSAIRRIKDERIRELLVELDRLRGTDQRETTSNLGNVIQFPTL